MIWLGWRQQRTETVIAAAILALVAVILVPVGIEMAHAYTRDGLSHCLGATQRPLCDELVGNFQQRFDKYNSLVGWFNLVPGLFGVALAGPFALELERGTHRLAWTQSITRRRWVATKLGLATGSTLVASAVLIAILVWWRQPLVKLDGRMDNGAFDAQGTVILGYGLFALGLALAIGALWRRAIPAAMVAFVGYFIARIFVDTWLRQRFITPKTVTWPAGKDQPASLARSWVFTEYPSNAAGTKMQPVPRACFSGTHAKCIVRPGFGYMHAVFEPASRFWALQGIETAAFGVTGIALIAFAGWWTLHRE
ncbi:MAG TPA: hypothetical protein VGU02_16470 [Gaiellaceae bacterium]|nr:hypothetical protein [Gaiellaceae bacterium]